MNENRIGSERVRLRMTQKELAVKIGLSNRTLSLFEQDASVCPTKTLVLLANLFGCTIDYLLGRADERIKQKSA